ncbi:MAG: hypothetical protein GY938_00545, partial [Ketobacter sp.]|nr:hypothetical protein [Ketobacter sp.]
TANVEIGDTITALQDAPTAESHWVITNKNLDAASIKALYESNADTNEFDDAEKTKLGTVATNADVGDMLASMYDPTAVGGDAFSAANTAIAEGVGSPTVDTVQEYLNSTGSAGFFEGGAVTDGGSGTVDVAAGSGFIRDSASSTAPLKSFKWSASAGITVTDDTTQYIFVDDTGAINLSTDEFLESEDNILIGCVTDEGGSIVSVFNLGVRLDESIAQAGRFIRRVHSISYDKRRGGLMFSETGTRNIVVTAGYLWWGRTEYPITALNTSAADTFTTYSVTGQEAAAATAWDNTQYDNAGTLTTMNNNRWANHYFFLEPNGNLTMIYGRAQYTTQELAEAEGVPTTSLPNKLTAAGVLAARFTFQESASTATVSSAFGANFAGSGSTSPGRQTMNFPASSFTVPASGGPDAGKTTEGTNGHTVDTFDFSGSVEEEMFLTIPFPKSYDGGDLYFDYEWISAHTGTG